VDTLTLEHATGCTSWQGILRFLTCGSVDDGKSTLIGRLLFDTGQVLDDQLDALESDNHRFGTVKSALDLALLVDGLRAEREQGITIDVAYRYFSTPRRKFMVVDAPGHEQYTRNMATGASACDLAVMLVDARKGLLTQTRRHAHIVHLLGIRHVVLAVNKMDLVSYSIDTFSAVATEFEQFARALGLERVICIPVVASSGGIFVHRCHPWPGIPENVARHLGVWSQTGESEAVSHAGAARVATDQRVPGSREPCGGHGAQRRRRRPVAVRNIHEGGRLIASDGDLENERRRRGYARVC
jgi:small GTP-binding protein